MSQRAAKDVKKFLHISLNCNFNYNLNNFEKDAGRVFETPGIDSVFDTLKF